MLKKYFNSITVLLIILTAFLTSCASTPKNQPEINEQPSQLSLLFAGDIMAHNINYNISSYEKIWRDVSDEIKAADLAFGNIESPVDQTKEASSFPNFNMTVSYLQAAIDAGFDVFSLANNHSFDQFESGIHQTLKSAEQLAQINRETYFSGLKKSKKDSYSFNFIEKNGWNILFLPVTEILNYPHDSGNINYVSSTEKGRQQFIQFVKELRKKYPCDLFVISVHANEPEYIRSVSKEQRNFYISLLEVCDIVWANHAHLIKDREFFFNTKTGRKKLIMYANGNTISGQRTRPDFANANSEENRDNTGDGLFYEITFIKQKNDKTVYNENGEPEIPVEIKTAKPFFITTYINTAYEFVIKPLNSDFINYLNEVQRKNWAGYVQKRILINNQETKDLITWQ